MTPASWGLRAIYERAGLPMRLLPAFRASVDAFHSLDFDGDHGDIPRFQRRMLERFLSQPQSMSREDDVDYLLDTKMDRLSDGRRGHGGRVASGLDGDQNNPAARLIIVARIAVLKAKEIRLCAVAMRRSSFERMLTSAVCDVAPMPTAK